MITVKLKNIPEVGEVNPGLDTGGGPPYTGPWVRVSTLGLFFYGNIMSGAAVWSNQGGWGSSLSLYEGVEYTFPMYAADGTSVAGRDCRISCFVTGAIGAQGGQFYCFTSQAFKVVDNTVYFLDLTSGAVSTTEAPEGPVIPDPIPGPGQTCTLDMQCPSGYVCVNGVCVPLVVTPEPTPTPEPAPTPEPTPEPTPTPVPPKKSNSAAVVMALIAIIVVALILPGK